MKQGLIGLLALLMVGSAWELGNSEGRGGGGPSGLSSSPNLLGSASKLKALAKKAVAKSAKAERGEKGPAQKKAEAKPSALAGLMDAKGSDDAPLAAAKGDMAMEEKPLAARGEDSSGDKIGALLAGKPALANKLAKALAAAPGEGKAGPVGLGDVAGVAAGEAMAAAASKAEAKAAKRPSRTRGRIIPGRSVIMGSLSKSKVTRAIRRRMRQIQYCYEKELAKKPTLSGKVTTRFVIGGNGRVQTAKVYQTTLGHAPTEKCIVRIFKRIRFPKPSGGGIVAVTYPLTFTR